MIEDKIAACHARARAALNASDKDVEHGLELHRDSFVCDCFAFWPGFCSREELQHINDVIAEGGSSEEVQEASEDARYLSLVQDRDLREQCRDALEAAGVDCLVSTVGVGPRMRRGLRNVARFTYLADALSEVVRKAVTADGIRGAYAAGDRSLVWSANSTPAMGPYEDGYDMLRWLETYYLLGIRMMHLTYNRRNWIGDGCTEPTDAGLSEFGREVVARLNDLGIITDTPHSGKQTTLDATRFSRAPVLASHTGCEAVLQHPRCKSDEEIRAIADTGGAIGIYLVPGFLADPEETSILALLAHIDHVVKLVGPEHVMIGSDSTFSMPPPADVERLPGPRSRRKWWSLWGEGDLKGDPRKEGSEGSLAWINWPYFTVGLVKLGYEDDDIRKIIGGNFVRVLGDVQRAALPRYRDVGPPTGDAAPK